jgi:hypothetical protein
MDGFVAFIIAVVAVVVGGFVWAINVVDDDLWNEAPNGCYVHEVHHNHFGADEKTVTLLCPVKEN